jgi:glycine amidinotransferase/scyllo-inosamine-4-phosphate amidinotransferase 1
MINSNNEWGRLKRVILGSTVNFNFSRTDEEYTKYPELPVGAANPDYIYDMENALKIFEKELKNLDVEVLRPKEIDYQKLEGFGSYCPRDTILIIGDKVIFTPTVWKKRRIEWESMKEYFPEIVIPDNPSVMFDAANIIRCNRDILYLVSYSGNEEGGDWLENFLGSEYRVHRIRAVYKGMHLDSTIVPLREGLVMLNSERVKEESLPDFMKSWDKIWLAKEDLIQDPNWTQLTTNWIGMNIFSYDENTIFCDDKQEKLKKIFYKYNIDTIGVNLPHAKYFMGGHHCSTLDILRD